MKTDIKCEIFQYNLKKDLKIFRNELISSHATQMYVGF